MSSKSIKAVPIPAPTATTTKEAKATPSQTENTSHTKKMKPYPKSKLTTSIQFDITNKSALADLAKR